MKLKIGDRVTYIVEIPGTVRAGRVTEVFQLQQFEALPAGAVAPLPFFRLHKGPAFAFAEEGTRWLPGRKTKEKSRALRAARALLR